MNEGKKGAEKNQRKNIRTQHTAEARISIYTIIMNY